MDSKVCSRCGEAKPITGFYARSDKPGAYRSICRDCQHRENRGLEPVIGTASAAVCGRCDRLLPLDRFYKTEGSRGHSYFCVDCSGTSGTARYNRNPMRILRKEDPDEYARRVLLSRRHITDGGCWEYMGAKHPGGYGMVRLGGREWTTHRLAYCLWIGPIPDGAQINHHCDNRPCFNPAHIYAGTQADNIRDAVSRGRNPQGPTHGLTLDPSRALRGEESPNHKLSEDDVRSIRRRHASGESQRSLARAFLVDRRTISFIVKREHWKHVA